MGVLDGRVAIVTGASSGIGRGCALRFADEGAKVVACARRVEKLQELVDEAESRGGTALAVACDVTNEEDIENVVNTTVETFGGVDILANIAQGGIEQYENNVADVSRERVLDFLVGGPLQSLTFMQKCFPHMKKKGYGRIINTASHAAMGAEGFAAYAIAKGAVMSLTRSACKEWGQFGIVTNTIMPNVLTEAWEYSPRVSSFKESLPPMVPVRRLGTPYEDLAPVIVFLASEQAGYVNGQVVAVDGGLGLIA